MGTSCSLTLLLLAVNTDTSTATVTCSNLNSDGWCVINCGNICQETTVYCAADVPCAITCDSEDACRRSTIQAASATDVDISCIATGDSESYMELSLYCGTGSCSLQCEPEASQSCQDPQGVSVASATSFTCTGNCWEFARYTFTVEPSGAPTTSPPTTGLPTTISPTTTSPSTVAPTGEPSVAPTRNPTLEPTAPMIESTLEPTTRPSAAGTFATMIPSANPSVSPTDPTKRPSNAPSTFLTKNPESLVTDQLYCTLLYLDVIDFDALTADDVGNDDKKQLEIANVTKMAIAKNAFDFDRFLISYDNVSDKDDSADDDSLISLHILQRICAFSNERLDNLLSTINAQNEDIETFLPIN